MTDTVTSEASVFAKDPEIFIRKVSDLAKDPDVVIRKVSVSLMLRPFRTGTHRV